jgi:RNA polymerase sigma factor (sigma-70 family)
MLAQLQLPPPARPPDPWAVALAYLPLVTRVAREFRHGEWDTDDLIQEGLIGARNAAARYDPGQHSFWRMAEIAARNRMRDWLRWRHCDDRATGDAALARDRADRWDFERLADVLAAIDCMPGYRRTILREHFGLYGPARTGAAIGDGLGMTRSAVAKDQLRALAWVRERLVPAARGPEVARPPCAICGDPDGTIPRSRRTPERLSLARFGLDGVACRRCYIRLYARQRVRKRLGVAS